MCFGLLLCVLALVVEVDRKVTGISGLRCNEDFQMAIPFFYDLIVELLW